MVFVYLPFCLSSIQFFSSSGLHFLLFFFSISKHARCEFDKSSGSILIFASYVIHRPLVFAGVLSVKYTHTYDFYGCCQGEDQQHIVTLQKVYQK